MFGFKDNYREYMLGGFIIIVNFKFMYWEQLVFNEIYYPWCYSLQKFWVIYYYANNDWSREGCK